MRRTRFSVVAPALLLACAWSCSLIHAAKPEVDETERDKVQQVLKSETASGTEALNRRAALKPALRPETKSDATWWQSGYVKIGNDWRSVDQSTASLSEAALLNEYHQLRTAATKTADGQFALANWCRHKKLTDQERSHLMQVLLLSDPMRDLTEVYARLGYQLIGQQWVSNSESDKSAKLNHETGSDFKRWSLRISRLVQNAGGTPQQRSQAEAELAKIEETNLIPVLTRVALENESFATMLLEHLSERREYQASQALAMLAALSPSPVVRSVGTSKLADRKMGEYVPALLAEMHCPVTVRDLGRGQRMLIREDANRILMIDLRVVGTSAWEDPFASEWVYIWSRDNPRMNGFYPVNEQPYSAQTPPTMNRRSMPSTVLLQNSILAQRRINDSERFTKDRQYRAESRATSANETAEAVNARVGSVLAAVSGQQENADPRFWWTWWSIQSGYQELPKQVVVVQEIEKIPARLVGVVQRSCLVSGTPIWTDRGFVAVETIQVGDCVLSKNIETGELAYKPVLHTTVRRPVPVRRFVVGGQPVVASAGHNFWVSGDGWTKTRELIPQQPIHTVIGMARVESIEDEPEPVPVYNLVVADFHTYFVGPAMILSHDVLPPRPTNVKVPGLAAK